MQAVFANLSTKTAISKADKLQNKCGSVGRELLSLSLSLVSWRFVKPFLKFFSKILSENLQIFTPKFTQGVHFIQIFTQKFTKFMNFLTKFKDFTHLWIASRFSTARNDGVGANSRIFAHNDGDSRPKNYNFSYLYPKFSLSAN